MSLDNLAHFVYIDLFATDSMTLMMGLLSFFMMNREEKRGE